MERVEEIENLVLGAYKLVPKEVGFGANCYQAAVKGTPFRSSSYLLKTMARAARHGLGAIVGVLTHNLVSKYVPWRNHRLVMRLLTPRYQSNSTASGSASPPAPPVPPNNCFLRKRAWLAKRPHQQNMWLQVPSCRRSIRTYIEIPSNVSLTCLPL